MTATASSTTTNKIDKTPRFLHCTHHSLCITRAVVEKGEIYDGRDGDSSSGKTRFSLRVIDASVRFNARWVRWRNQFNPGIAACFFAIVVDCPSHFTFWCWACQQRCLDSTQAGATTKWMGLSDRRQERYWKPANAAQQITRSCSKKAHFLIFTYWLKPP
jgi:hypothetical protein